MRIVVYCSAAEELRDEWRRAARAVGDWIGRNGAELVYGGIDLGLMREVAEATKDAGGRVTGVVPRKRASMAFKGNDVNLPATDLADRKEIMQQLGDVFVVLPGGYGTLDELASAFAYTNFSNLSHKKIVVFNHEGLFDPWLEQLQVMIDRGLMLPERMNTLRVVTTIDELIKSLFHNLC